MKSDFPNENDPTFFSHHRIVAVVENFYTILERIHSIENCHVGYKKTLTEIQRMYECFPRQAVQYFCNTCPVCQQKAPQTSNAPLKPIISSGFLTRCQIDLIDMRHMPDDSYKYIAHFMDHWSKFHILWPMMKKSAIEVSMGLVTKVFPYLGLPKILQSDNGREFVNDVVKETLKLWPGEVKIINGRPRHSQSQGVVEKGNHLVEMQLQAMKSELKVSSMAPWVDWLPRIQYNLNTQICRTLKTSPYEVVFGQPPRFTPFPALTHHKSGSIIMEEDISDLIKDCDHSTSTSSSSLSLPSNTRGQSSLSAHPEFSIDQSLCDHSTIPPGCRNHQSRLSAHQNSQGHSSSSFCRNCTSQSPSSSHQNSCDHSPLSSSESSRSQSPPTARGDPLSPFGRNRSKFSCSPHSRESSLSSSRQDSTPLSKDHLSRCHPLHSCSSDSQEHSPYSSGQSSRDTSPDERSGHGELSDIVSALQRISPADFVKGVSDLVADYMPEKCNSEINSEFFSLSCVKRNQLKYASNAVACVTSEQYEAICDFLISRFCTNKSMKYFSYALDYVFPRVLHKFIVKNYNLESDEAQKVMYTDLPPKLNSSDVKSEKESSGSSSNSLAFEKDSSHDKPSQSSSDEIPPDESSCVPQKLATSERHLLLRQQADHNYRKNAERMKLQYSKRKGHKITEYVAGDTVTVRIPRNERSSSDLSRLLCRVVEVKGNHMYRLLSEYGVLSTCYPSSELMPYKGSAEFPDFDSNECQEEKKISLREAAHKAQKIMATDKKRCNCSSTCQKSACSCRLAGLDCTSHCHPKNSACLNKDCSLESPKSASKLLKRRRKYETTDLGQKRRKVVGLGEKGMKMIENNCWLDDKHVDAANHLLKKQFPNLLGLYSPVLGQSYSFPVTKDPFIQILNVGGNHWITVVGVSSNLVHVYDSVYDYVMDDAKMQVGSILRTLEPSVTFRVHKTQFQEGSNDCGLFSIAYATDLAYGNDPASFKYVQKDMRSHFLDCLRKGKLEPFPKAEILPERPKNVPVLIHCSCRLPDNQEEKMACCGKCKVWYHQSCENIPNQVFQSKRVTWKCSQCT